MSNKLRSPSVLCAAALAAWCASGAALAADEVEPNHPASSAQRLVIGSDGSVQVNGVMGVVSGTPFRDVDFYAFDGQEGDVVTVDIDGGMQSNGKGVDTIVAIFGPASILPLRQVDDAASLDSGSVSRLDSRIDNVRLPFTGRYVIGVSSFPGAFRDINTLSSMSLFSTSNGAYTLIVSGVTPSTQQINILVKPDTTEVAPVNPKSRGRIPVALLSSKEFDPLEVDPETLRFGARGDEDSLARCHKSSIDYNGDLMPDLVCHFHSPAANFDEGDTEGVLTGATKSGDRFEGRAWLKVVGGKKRR